MAKKNIRDYLLEKDGSLIAKDSIKIVIPKFNFENNLAEEIDSTVKTFGIFKIYSLDEKDSYQCTYPLELILNVFGREVVDGDIHLIYKKNDIIIDSMTYISNVKAAIKFLTLITSGKIDIGDPEELVNIFKNNMTMNGANIRVPSELIEAMVSELVRWKDDPSVPFRLKYGQVSRDDYIIINIKDISRVSSVFGAISFEDIKKALQAAVTITRTKQKQRVSPLESVLYY